ncbi:MAG TPA: hypothetical protein VGL53_03605 [Bryobacteraceae bacterium]
MASYLPRVNATVAYVDFDKLRDAGMFDLIAGSKSLEELDYRQFVDASGFDYRSDLGAVVIAFQGDNRFVVARGKFDWRKINDYLTHLGGTCHNTYCNYQSHEALGRSVSYFPIRPSVMGLYSGTAEWGVYELAQRHVDDRSGTFPDAPVWISVPASAWSTPKDLPPGGKAFASVFAEAERVVFTINADASKNLHLYADVDCGNPDNAVKINGRLAEATGLLRKMLAREHETPNPGDLSGLLVGGEFRIEGTHVKASWPLQRAFVEALVSGGVN